MQRKKKWARAAKTKEKHCFIGYEVTYAIIRAHNVQVKLCVYPVLLTTYQLQETIGRQFHALDAQVNVHNLLATKLVSRKLITAGDGERMHEIKFPISSVCATGWHAKSIAKSVICVKHHSWSDRRWDAMHLIIRFDAITCSRAQFTVFTRMAIHT